MRKFLLRGLFFMLVLPATAQDVHFSQFYTTPLQVNPALTGVFDGTFRVSNTYRSQWASHGKGYKTIHFSADAPLAKGNLDNNFFGVGLLVYQDKAGTAELKTTILEGSLSYITSLDDANDNYISIGFQAGLNQQSMDLASATWDNQWNGDKFDPVQPSFEAIQLEQFAYLDFNAGLLYYYVPDANNSFNVGASMSHIGSPNISFFIGGESPLRRKLTFHSSGEIALNREATAWITPKAITMFQGKQKEIMFGGFFKSKVQFKSLYTRYRKEAYFNIGGFYRVGDAAVLAARFEYNAFGLGISYDMNTSTLSNLAGSANAFEINLSFVNYVKRGQRSKHFNKMPKFF